MINLVTRSNCPNCRIAKQLLDENKINYNAIDADKNMEYCRKNNIQTVPAVVDGVFKFCGLSSIKDWFNHRSL